jgi:hypothetical protein
MTSEDRGRHAVLRHAAGLASVYGLEGLTFGKLASASGYTRSGVASMFDTKRDLQRETIAGAEGVFMGLVFEVATAEPGLERLGEIFDRWLTDYLGYFPGGCFFAATASECDDQGDPATREALIAAIDRIQAVLVAEIRLAQRVGDVSDLVVPTQLAFELHALVQEANYARRLRRSDDAVELALELIHNRLASVATSGTSSRSLR